MGGGQPARNGLAAAIVQGGAVAPLAKTRTVMGFLNLGGDLGMPCTPFVQRAEIDRKVRRGKGWKGNFCNGEKNRLRDSTKILFAKWKIPPSEARPRP